MSNSKEIFTNAFVDLMASALGCVVIMMLVFAVKKSSASHKIGMPRGFVYYSFKTEDEDAELEFYFRNGSGNASYPFTRKRLKDFYNKIGPDTVALSENFAAYMWGPAQDDFDDKSKRYNFYVVLSRPGDWDFGVRYYDRLTLKANKLIAPAKDPEQEIRRTIEVIQRLRTNDTTIVDTAFIIHLGDECNLSVKIK